MSGFRSVAIRLFFERQPEPLEQPAHRRAGDRLLLIGCPLGAMLGQRGVGVRRHLRAQRVPLIETNQQRPPRCVAGDERVAAVRADAPAIETRNTDAGGAFDLSCRESRRFGSQQPLTEINLISAGHTANLS
jgi:hypothetical protein